MDVLESRGGRDRRSVKRKHDMKIVMLRKINLIFLFPLSLDW